jgi:hypothetical protein
LPQFVSPQLSQPVAKPPSGPQWVHEIKLDGFRMAARIDNGRVQLLTRTGPDWTTNYPSAIAALANVNVKTAYLDGDGWLRPPAGDDGPRIVRQGERREPEPDLDPLEEFARIVGEPDGAAPRPRSEPTSARRIRSNRRYKKFSTLFQGGGDEVAI